MGIYQIKEFNPNKDYLLYHGGKEKVNSFKVGILFLTPNEAEAEEFGKGSHILGYSSNVSYFYTIGAKYGKTHDSDGTITDFIMETENPIIDESILPNEDLDSWIDRFYAVFLKKQGYRYFSFSHPSFFGDKNIEVIVSLYPDKDLEIVDVEKV